MHNFRFFAVFAALCGLAFAASGAHAQTVTRFEETNSAVSLSAGWTEDSGEPWSGGSAAISSSAGAQATFSFTGTSVTWLGGRSNATGIAQVFLDGKYVADVDTYSKTQETRVPMYTMNGLADTSHTLTIEVTGTMNASSNGAVIVVDAFDVPGPAVSRLQETDPEVSFGRGWVEDNGLYTYTVGITGQTPQVKLRNWSGGAAALTSTAGASATFTFTGTSVSWIGAQGTQSGTARVYLDGKFVAGVDLYSSVERIQAEVFKATGLADTTHTLTIEATGQHDPASQGALVVVDAFEVTAPGTRLQETDPSIAYGSDWIQGNRDVAYSEGTAAESNTPYAQASFTFTGAGVRWIGARGPQTGIARVWLDGVLVGDLDMYWPTEGPQHTVFAARGLAAGTHTLAIEVLPNTNPASTDHWILIDAFDVIH